MIPHLRAFCQGEESFPPVMWKKVEIFFISSFLFSQKDGNMGVSNTVRMEDFV